MVTIYIRYEIKVFVNRSHKHRIKKSKPFPREEVEPDPESFDDIFYN